jgi:uncharacterized protein
MSPTFCLPKIRVPKFAAGLLSVLFVLALGSAWVHAEQVKNLKPQGYVNDFAGVLSAQAKEKLAALCAEVDQKTKAQIAVVTVSSLEGQPVEQFSIDLATQWGVGPKQQARGIMILLAPNDRKYRIEVGYGLEAILPDGKVGGFGREAVPFLQRSDYDGAALLLTQRVAAVIAADQKITLDTLSGVSPPEPESSNGPARLGNLVSTLFIVIFLLFPFLGFLLRLFFGSSINSRRRGGGMWMGGPWYGGGGFGGGGGGGGGGPGGGGDGAGGGGGPGVGVGRGIHGLFVGRMSG